MVGSRLNLKLLRDLRFSPYLFSGIVLLTLVGIALFGASYELYLNLKSSYQLSYEKLNLADFSISLQSAPTEVLTTIRRIPGVRAVEGRTVEDAEIDQPKAASRKVIGRIISLPDYGEPRVSQLKLIAGSYPRPDASRELLLEASFAKYHNYQPGDILRVVILGDKVRFRITGIVQSPEYIYVVRSREEPMPSPRLFGVMWMRKAMVDDLFGSSGSINDVQVRMAPGGTRRTAMRLAGRILSPYGADDPVPREEQPSVEFLRLDLMGLQSLAIFFPILFLTISSLSTYNLLGRMVHAQRSQIGFLRAVGFGRAAVGMHYLQFSVLIGLIGGVLGSIAGHYGGIWLTGMYTRYIQVPYFDTSPKWDVVIAGFLVAIVVTVISGLIPSLHAAKLPPAQAIGVEAPMGSRAPIIERYLPFLRRFSLLARLPLRNFLRNPRRTFSTVAGVASAATLILVSAGLLDSTVASIDFYFKHSLHYNVLATYLHPQTQVELARIENWKGVRRVEPILSLPAKLVKGDKAQNTIIYGLRPGDRLMTLTDIEGRRIPLQSEGLMIADATAEKLGLWSGAMVRLTLPKQTIPETPDPGQMRRVRRVSPVERLMDVPTYSDTVLSSSRALLETRMDKLVRVSGTTYQPVGNAVFAPIEQVRRWYGRALELPPGAINAAAIEVDPEYVVEVERELYKLDGVASVQVKQHIIEEIEEMLKQSNVFFNVMLGFSVALAAVIIFNSTLMNVIERTRELATLRTVGVSAAAAARMVIVENLLAYVWGIIIGLPFGTWLAGQFVQMYDSEAFHMQTVIFARTYWMAVLGILATVLIFQLPGLRYIRGIELARATKDVG